MCISSINQASESSNSSMLRNTVNSAQVDVAAARPAQMWIILPCSAVADPDLRNMVSVLLALLAVMEMKTIAIRNKSRQVVYGASRAHDNRLRSVRILPTR